MNKFKLKNKNIRFIIIFVFIIVTSYTYFYTFINDSLDELIINEVKSKYNKTKINIKDKLLYKSYNKNIVKLDSKINEDKIIEIIDNTENKIMNNDSKKTVYIYNTHDTEKYSLFYDNGYSITPDVRIASYILKDHLNDLGVNSYVQNKSINDYLKKHNLSYKGCYEASRYYLTNELINNDYKVFLDIHRDSIKRKYTLYEKDNIKYAKVLFVLTTKHKNYKGNEKFANYLNNKLNKDYKGLSRGIMKRKDVIFNQDISVHSILIEVGGVENSLDEINNTLKVIASILKDYIEEEKL